MVLVVLHLRGEEDRVTPALRRDYESLFAYTGHMSTGFLTYAEEVQRQSEGIAIEKGFSCGASSYVVVVAVEILRLMELPLTAVYR